MLTGSIDLSKIDKEKLYVGKNGNKYLNVKIWINDSPDQYGNIASIQQATGKDEKKIYIGNLKEFNKVEEVIPEDDIF
jgi:hypothetical protein